MKKHTLTAEKRTIEGRKVKKLRRDGKIPATVYGKHLKSESVTVKEDEFRKIFTEAGETGLIELTVGKDIHPVLINVVQIEPVKQEILHVEFHKVDLKEKVHAKVPVIHIGVAPAMESKLGVLLTLVDEIEVEALPAELPEHIEIDVSTLANVDDEITVAQITAPKGVTVLTEGDVALVRISPLVTKAAEEEAAKEAAEQAEAKVEAAGEAEAAASEAKPQEAKKEESAKEA